MQGAGGAKNNGGSVTSSPAPASSPISSSSPACSDKKLKPGNPNPNPKPETQNQVASFSVKTKEFSDKIDGLIQAAFARAPAKTAPTPT